MQHRRALWSAGFATAILVTLALAPLASAVSVPATRVGGAAFPCDPVGGELSRADCLNIVCQAVAKGAGLRQATYSCVEVACVAAGMALQGHSCNVVLCQDVPAVYQTVTIAGGNVLGLLPTPAIVYNVLVKLGVVCEPGTGGGSGSGCPEVLATPAVHVGLHVAISPSLTPGAVNVDCFWATTGVGGPTWLVGSDTAWVFANPTSCAQVAKVTIGTGASGVTYVLSNGC